MKISVNQSDIFCSIIRLCYCLLNQRSLLVCADIMTRDVQCLPAIVSVSALVAFLRTSEHNGFPVLLEKPLAQTESVPWDPLVATFVLHKKKFICPILL